MADDFRIKIDSDLDLSKAESKINSFLSKYNGKEKIKLDVDVNVGDISSVSTLVQKKIQNGLKNVKFDKNTFFDNYIKQLEKDVDEAINLTQKYQNTLLNIGSAEYSRNALNAVKAKNKEEEKLNRKALADSNKLMNQKVQDINKANKEQEALDKKNYQTRKKNAESLLRDELSLIDKQQKNKAAIIKNSALGNTDTVAVLKEERNKMKSEMKKLNTEMNQYKDIFDAKTHNEILNNKRRDSKSIVDLQRAGIIDSAKEAEKQNQIIEKAFTELRKNSYQSIGSKSNIQSDMSDYYRQLEIDSAKEAEKLDRIKQKISNSVSDFNSLKYAVKDGGSQKYGNTGYEKLVSQISAAENALQKFNAEAEKGDDANLDKLNADMKEFVSLANKVAREQSKLSENVSSNKQISALKDLERYWKANTKAHKDYEGIYESYKSALSGGRLTAGQFEDVSSGIKNMKKDIEIAGKSGRSFSEELTRGFKQIGQFVGTYGVLQNVAQEIPSQIIQAVRDINKSQTELTKVSSAPTSELSSYWDRAADSAKKYGSTISDVIDSTADWSRLGYSLEDAEKLSNATTLLKNVGDNMTQESSSSGLISTLKGFKLAADEAESIVDKVNEVANTQPIDTAGIFEGLKRSASSMSAANNTLEETIALITAANSVVQDPASVGTAYKTVSMRIRGATTELQEAGLDTEGMASSTAKLREELIALSGVDIMIDNSTFKSTYQILEELSEKWSSLSDIQQASITELIAGKRQGNLVSALMTNFDIAEEALDTALNKSSGSASKELENWNRGVESSIEHFKAQFQELASVALSSDFFKGFVDSGTSALNILTQIIDKVGILTPLIAGIATKQGLGKRSAILYKAKQNYRRFVNVENFVTSNTNKPYRINY